MRVYKIELRNQEKNSQIIFFQLEKTMSNISNKILNNATGTYGIDLSTYSTPLISLIGLILNLFCLSILLKPSFKQKYKFRYIIVKLTLDLLMCLVSTGFFDSDCVLLCVFKNDFFSTAYTLYLKFYIVLLLYVFSGYNETLLTYDRILILENKKHFSNKKGYFKYVLLIEFLITLVITSPFLFAYSIKSTQYDTNKYHVAFTEVGNTIYYKYYEVIMLSLTNSIVAFVLLRVSINTIKAYKSFISRRSLSHFNMISEKKFTIMVILLSGSFLIVRIIGFARGITRLICLITGKFAEESKNLDIIVQYALSINASTNFFILIIFNTTFRKNIFS